ncbi:SDR family NAD(P)-dependent oxidoreductase [Acidithrix sp. C25]|uniref:SDR family NAD(P)-dependent oxidoreductase n=1 Tax=Acidithrix sp. C25 TaxID=1671482 RepID=UPI00191BBE5F|nr:SDR family NAD(P)-dependent oxidoreductase [Acidithrix sp. C25]CAG4930002.1 unnamed protein product [Acidithrix sp. C25]
MNGEIEPETSSSWLGLDGRGVLIAGAGGIGSACAKAFIGGGARIVLVDQDQARLEATTKEIHGPCKAIVADLSVATSARMAVKQATEVLGEIDIFIHCVGINQRKPVLDVSEDDWTKVLRINLDSAFWLAQSVGRSMVERGFGRIIILSSVSGLLAHPDHAPYAASKGAINQMMRVMAREWAPFGVTVNAIAPGYTETDLTMDYLERDGNRAKLQKMVPAGRLGTTQELTGPALFLASPHSSFITGHVLYVDGGRTLV